MDNTYIFFISVKLSRLFFILLRSIHSTLKKEFSLKSCQFCFAFNVEKIV